MWQLVSLRGNSGVLLSETFSEGKHRNDGDAGIKI